MQRQLSSRHFLLHLTQERMRHILTEQDRANGRMQLVIPRTMTLRQGPSEVPFHGCP